MTKNHTYFILYKPYGVLNQFTDDQGRPTLASLYDFPKGVYPVGRLDLDSEGLLILTDDTTLNHRLTHPKFEHQKEYWVQVENLISSQAIKQLEQGVTISVEGKKYHTLPARASLLKELPRLPERNPPIRFRKNIPTSWIKIILQEGKNRQVRKMTAAIGFPTLRLVRYAIEGLTLGGLQPGQVQALSAQQIYYQLFQSH